MTAGGDKPERPEEESPIKFRNYIPKDPSLKKLCLPRRNAILIEENIDKEMKAVMEASAKEDALSRITPKRPNWDLKRDIDQKLNLLSHRTDKAIVQLIRRAMRDSAVAQSMAKEAPSGKKMEVETSEEHISSAEREVATAVMSAIERATESATDI